VFGKTTRSRFTAVNIDKSIVNKEDAEAR